MGDPCRPILGLIKMKTVNDLWKIWYEMFQSWTCYCNIWNDSFNFRFCRNCIKTWRRVSYLNTTFWRRKNCINVRNVPEWVMLIQFVKRFFQFQVLREMFKSWRQVFYLNTTFLIRKNCINVRNVPEFEKILSISDFVGIVLIHGDKSTIHIPLMPSKVYPGCL